MANKDKKEKEKKQKDPEEKLELAKKIAANSDKVAKTYENVENSILSFFRSFSNGFNKLIFNSKFSKIAALIIAICVYLSVNVTDSDSLNITQSTELSDITVQVVYNSEIYEISGVPETVSVIVSGDVSDITLQKSRVDSKVVCDLSGLTEGTYSIKLEPTNFNSRLSVNVLDTPSVTVTIKKKVTAKFNITSEFINTNSMDSIYTLGDVTFDTTEVLIRASQDTLDTISTVRALIDVSGATEDFNTTCTLVAYDQSGNTVDVDIIPETVTATVTVSTPSKEVPIVVRFSGTISDGLAIDSVTLDYSSVILYGPEAILELTDAIYIDLDVSTITKNTVVSTALTVPSGVNSMSVTKINMEINVAEETSAVIEDVPVTWVNYTSDYRFSVTDANDAYVSVIVTGTESNIASITADDITVALDLSDITLGTQQVEVTISGTNDYLTYELADGRTTIEIEVIEGE